MSVRGPPGKDQPPYSLGEQHLGVLRDAQVYKFRPNPAQPPRATSVPKVTYAVVRLSCHAQLPTSLLVT